MKLYLIDSKILKSSRYSASLGCLNMFNSSLRDAFCSSKSPHSSPVVNSNGNAVPIGLSQSSRRHGINIPYIFLLLLCLLRLLLPRLFLPRFLLPRLLLPRLLLPRLPVFPNSWMDCMDVFR